MQKFLVLLILFLSACSSPQPQSEALSWPWVYSNGAAVQLPDEWLFVGNSFDVLTLQDSKGSFRISLGYYADEEAVPQNESFETIRDGVRLLRREAETEFPVDGTKEIVSYLVFYPAHDVLSAELPKTSNIAEREVLFRELALSFQAPTGNVIAFWGGYAGTMSYPEDWEINWNMADSLSFRSEAASLSITFYPEYQETAVFGFPQDSTYAERAEAVITQRPVAQADLPGLLELHEIGDTTVVVYDSQQAAFSVDGTAWFYFAYSLNDDAPVFEMMRAIIDTYHFSDLSLHLGSTPGSNGK